MEPQSRAGRREQGSVGFNAVLKAQGFSWQAAPRDPGKMIKQVLQ